MPGLPLPLSSLCLPVSLSLSLSLCLSPRSLCPCASVFPLCMSASPSLFCISPFLPLPGLHSQSATHGFQCVNGTHACTHLANGGMQGRRNKCVGPCEGQGWVDRAPCLCLPGREPGTQGCGGFLSRHSLHPPSCRQPFGSSCQDRTAVCSCLYIRGQQDAPCPPSLLTWIKSRFVSARHVCLGEGPCWGGNGDKMACFLLAPRWAWPHLR